MDGAHQQDTICRSCMLHLQNVQHNLLETNEMTELYTRLSSTNLDKDDPLPKAICERCHQRLRDFESFQTMCAESYTTLLLQIPLKVDFKEEALETQVKEEQLESASLNVEIHESGEFVDGLESDNESFGSFEAGRGDPLKDEDDPISELTKVAEGLKNNGLSATVKEQNESDNEPLSDLRRKTPARRKSKREIPAREIKVKAEKMEIERPIPQRKPKVMKKVIACPKCPKTFFKQFRYDAHMRTHEGLKAYACALCKKGYSKPSRLRYHMRSEHDPNVELVHCTFDGCEKAYKNRETLAQHMKIIHINPPDPNERKNRPGIICELCGKVLSSKAVLQKHTLIHTNEFPFACDICPKKYRTQCKLDVHKKKHEGIKEFQCQVCGLKKTTGHELNVHMNVHTREKTYPCEMCKACFLNHGNLARHIRVVHKGIKTYQCTYCDQSFGKAETLKHHVMRHTGEKPHQCPICGKRFIQKTSFQYHVRRHSKDKGVSAIPPAPASASENDLNAFL